MPPCPNVDAFNFENLKSALLERIDCFRSAPFTVQRLCELLTNPKKHYCRLDKFMRALEKNILGRGDTQHISEFPKTNIDINLLN